MYNSLYLARKYCTRRGAVLVFTLVTVFVLLGFAALTIDVGYLYNTRAELQNAADAAALAAVRGLPDIDEVRATARKIVSLNQPHDPHVFNDSDLQIGNWDAENGLFVEGGPNPDAVRIILQKSESNGNPLGLFFAGLLGINQTNVSASAVAAAPRECFERGLTAGRYFITRKIKMYKTDGDICIYGREGVDIEKLELKKGDADVTIGSLDESDIMIDKIKLNKVPHPGKSKKKRYDDSLLIVEYDYQPKQANRVSDLIDEVERGTFPSPDLSVVVLNGPVTFGKKGGETMPTPDTAYVINGDAFIKDKFKGPNLVIAARGTVRFAKNVELKNADPTGPGSIPLYILATDDVDLDHDAKVSGGAIIAGRDVLINHKLAGSKKEDDFGFSIEAARDIIIGKDFKLKKLDIDLEIPLFDPIDSTLVQ